MSASEPKKITIRQVAEAANVSSATVSLVLNGPESGGDRISPETRNRVLEAVTRLGYFPNQSARSLRKQSTERVCLAVNDIGIPHNRFLAQDVNRVANENGLMTIIALMGSPEQEHKVLHQMRRGLADGVILNTPSFLSNEEISALAQSGCAVAIYSNHLNPVGVDVVRSGEADAALVALKYLYHKGHRRIGYIGNVSGKMAPMLRYETYLSFMANYSLPVEDGFLQYDLGVSRENAYQQALNFLRLANPPSAIFAGSDLAAISTIQAITNSGLRVPEDIAVIGSGNIPEGELLRPALTTIGPGKIDFSMLVYFLFSRVKGEAPPEGRHHSIPWNLIQRESA